MNSIECKDFNNTKSHIEDVLRQKGAMFGFWNTHESLIGEYIIITYNGTDYRVSVYVKSGRYTRAVFWDIERLRLFKSLMTRI